VPRREGSRSCRHRFEHHRVRRAIRGYPEAADHVIARRRCAGLGMRIPPHSREVGGQASDPILDDFGPLGGCGNDRVVLVHVHRERPGRRRGWQCFRLQDEALRARGRGHRDGEGVRRGGTAYVVVVNVRGESGHEGDARRGIGGRCVGRRRFRDAQQGQERGSTVPEALGVRRGVHDSPLRSPIKGDRSGIRGSSVGRVTRSGRARHRARREGDGNDGEDGDGLSQHPSILPRICNGVRCGDGA
jgi:hypothetical protein